MGLSKHGVAPNNWGFPILVVIGWLVMDTPICRYVMKFHPIPTTLLAEHPHQDYSAIIFGMLTAGAYTRDHTFAQGDWTGVSWAVDLVPKQVPKLWPISSGLRPPWMIARTDVDINMGIHFRTEFGGPKYLRTTCVNVLMSTLDGSAVLCGGAEDVGTIHPWTACQVDIFCKVETL